QEINGSLTAAGGATGVVFRFNKETDFREATKSGCTQACKQIYATGPFAQYVGSYSTAGTTCPYDGGDEIPLDEVILVSKGQPVKPSVSGLASLSSGGALMRSHLARRMSVHRINRKVASPCGPHSASVST